MYTLPGSGLTQQSPATETVLQEMTTGYKQYAEARRHAELQAAVISNKERQEIQRRRAASAGRDRAAALAAAHASSAKSEVQAALERRRAALESVPTDAAPNEASAAVTAPLPPTGAITASTKELTSTPPQATATLGTEERQGIQRRRAASVNNRRIAASEDILASAAKSELQAALERRRITLDCDAAEVQAAEDCGGGARTPTQLSEQCMHELEDNSQVAPKSLQPTGDAETAGMQSHLEHHTSVKDGFAVSDTHSAQKSHDSFKATQAITSTRTQRAAATAAAAVAAAELTTTASPFAGVPETVESGMACKRKQKRQRQPKCCCTIS